jgi:hypothetical protein
MSEQPPPSELDPPIIISGGSVTIKFDKKNLKETADGKHHHPNKRIKRVQVNGEDIKSFDEKTDSGMVTITIHYGD